MEYLSEEVSCAQHSTDKTINHKLQMGIHCNTPDGPLVTRFDYFFECGRDDDFGTVDLTYTCITSTEVASSSAANNIATIESTEMYTNYQWSRSASQLSGCFTYSELSP